MICVFQNTQTFDTAFQYSPGIRNSIPMDDCTVFSSYVGESDLGARHRQGQDKHAMTDTGPVKPVKPEYSEKAFPDDLVPL